mmetsp:Transcript_15375/g.20209  ORF Transcript_15375/g.20209 Transcript_15375/m.20209 type:complete len:90 (-) Transcript_15375:170-439(-)
MQFKNNVTSKKNTETGDKWSIRWNAPRSLMLNKTFGASSRQVALLLSTKSNLTFHPNSEVLQSLYCTGPKTQDCTSCSKTLEQHPFQFS